MENRGVKILGPSSACCVHKKKMARSAALCSSKASWGIKIFYASATVPQNRALQLAAVACNSVSEAEAEKYGVFFRSKACFSDARTCGCPHEPVWGSCSCSCCSNCFRFRRGSSGTGHNGIFYVFTMSPGVASVAGPVSLRNHSGFSVSVGIPWSREAVLPLERSGLLTAVYIL